MIGSMCCATGPGRVGRNKGLGLKQDFCQSHGMFFQTNCLVQTEMCMVLFLHLYIETISVSGSIIVGLGQSHFSLL